MAKGTLGRARGWQRQLPPATVIALAAVTRTYDLAGTGQNLYYAAAVRSMLDSWHNFFFLSFDPSGSIMVDKPPLGLWLQAAVAEVFGFRYWALAIPQVVAGVAAVWLVYLIARRWYGRPAALLAALVLSVMPISVASSRNNSLDTLTMALMLAAVWALLRAIDGPARARWLMLVAVFAALAFNTKGFAAFVPAPAMAVAYLYGVRDRLGVLWKPLAGAAAVFTILSLAWVAVVGATPAPDRPYVYNGYGNSIWALTFRYNGTDRLVGHRPQERLRATGGYTDAVGPDLNVGSIAPARGPLRLLNGRMGSQLGWFIPAASLGALLLLVPSRRRPVDLLFVAWFATGLLVFSFASDVKPQYLEAMTAPTALLAGYALAVAVSRRADRRLQGALVALSAVVAVALLWSVDDTRALSLAIGVVATLFVVALLLPRPLRVAPGDAFSRGAAALIVGLVLAGPFAWTIATAIQPATGSAARYPTAGPRDIRPWPPAAGGDAPAAGVVNNDDPVLAYLASESPPDGFLVLTERSLFGNAPRYILVTNRPVLTLDSYSTPAEAAEALGRLVDNGELRFLELPALGPWSDTANPFGAWFAGHCIDITSQMLKPLGGAHLYDCSASRTQADG